MSREDAERRERPLHRWSIVRAVGADGCAVMETERDLQIEGAKRR